MFGQGTEGITLRNPDIVSDGNKLLVGALHGISASRVRIAPGLWSLVIQDLVGPLVLTDLEAGGGLH